ncbi:MAG TPA: FUSC family protein, partial [Rhodanobacteraceae bacterium]|nr:FUSC family protein [Rhodanobacteraceae bacterium]
MPAGTWSLRASLIGTLFGARRPDVPLRVALRNTAAVALPLAVGFASGHAVVGLGIAAGALNVMFSDQPGPYRQRLQVIVMVSLAAAVSGLLGFLVGGHALPLALVVLLCGFGGGLLVVFGPNMARVGMTSMILLVITAATPLPWRQALAAATLIFAGGVLQAVFSVAAWPLQRYRPEREALAAVFRDLAALARRQMQDTDAPPVTDTLTQLQQTLLGRHHARGRAMEAFHVLLELAERIRLALMALPASPAGAGLLATFREDVARVLAGIAEALERAEPPQRAERALQALRATEAAMPAAAIPPGALLHAHALAGQLAAAARNSNWAGSRGELRARAADTRLPKALRNAAPLAVLRANLGTRSVAFRHAVRCAVCLGLALAISRYAGLQHGYWLPMTAAIVLRPDFGATFKFGLLRVIGTVLGLLLTSALLYLAPGDVWSHLALMTVLCFAFRYLATAHYGVAVAALTGTVVILLAFEGVDSASAVLDRVINTALGSGMALLAYVLWPTWERGRARAALADMLDAYADYLRALGRPQRRSAYRETR